MIDTLYIYAPEADFVIPYIKEALPGVKIIDSADDISRANLAIMLSSCDIYGEGEKVCLDEEAPVDPTSRWVSLEQAFEKTCLNSATPYAILRCADIIGTGMTGYMRALANDIWRGFFFHLPGNEARRSTIHASDIARIAHALASGGMPASGLKLFNVSDGSDPTLHDIAEALAFRMNNKRISTLSTRPQQMVARLVYGRKKITAYTTTRTFSAARLARELAFKATPACEYLHTHVYDDNSL